MNTRKPKIGNQSVRFRPRVVWPTLLAVLVLLVIAVIESDHALAQSTNSLVTSVIADIKMCKNAGMELTQPKVVASSADTRRRCRRHIAKGGSSERDIRDERRWPFDPGDRQGAGGIAEHGAPVSAIAGGDAAEGAATKRVEAGSVHRVHRRADGGGVGKLHGAAPGVDRLGL